MLTLLTLVAYSVSCGCGCDRVACLDGGVRTVFLALAQLIQCMHM